MDGKSSEQGRLWYGVGSPASMVMATGPTTFAYFFRGSPDPAMVQVRAWSPREVIRDGTPEGGLRVFALPMIESRYGLVDASGLRGFLGCSSETAPGARPFAKICREAFERAEARMKQLVPIPAPAAA